VRKLVAAILFALVFACFSQAPARTPANPPAYGQYPGRQQYSPLSQINTKNVQQLHVAWTYDTGGSGKTFEATPIVVNNVMYFPTPDSKVVALDALTGQKMWEYDPGVSFGDSRGVAYWPGGPHTPPRILFATSDGRLIALDPMTGRLIPGFGDQGEVDVRKLVLGSSPGSLGYTSAPAVLQDTVILSPRTQEGPRHGVSGNGDPRAFDALTGKPMWQFHTLPLPGQKQAQTWGGPKGVTDRSGPSAWAPIAVDPTRNLVFVTTGNPADSYYGADRPGNNLYANSIVALDAGTGKMRWYFQMVHHDMWDFDGVDSAVIQVNRDGKTIPAVAALDKDGFLFILNEMTGKPIFGVKERPVPKSDVPGEVSSPTQPFPSGPPPLSRDSMSTADINNVTPQSEQYCSELWSHYHNNGPFTPYGSTPTVNFPSTIGGPNWDSLSFDPQLGYIFVNTSELGGRGQMKQASAIPPRFPGRGRGPGRGRAPGARGIFFRQMAKYQMPYRNAMAAARFIDPDGYPCQKPPWGLLTAVNANTGKIVWRVPLGDYGKVQETGMSTTTLTTLPEGPGRNEVQTSCSSCHGIATVLQQRSTRVGWTAVVNDMVSRGLRVSGSQKEDIINYLSRFLGTSAANPPASAAQTGQPQPSTVSSESKHEPTGTPNIGGSLSTAGNVVFIGSTLDEKFRAFDALTGQVLWSYSLDGVGMATPMSFMGSDGKQYVVIATGGPGLLRAIHNDAGNSPDKIVVFTLSR
jgi:glucose dehydrogenase